ncbi:unnamed protein product [Calypogeia fissa]
MAFRMGCRISILSVMLLLFAISISKTRANNTDKKRKNEEEHEIRAPIGWRPLLLDAADQHYVVEPYPAGVMHPSDVRSSDINGEAFVQAHFNGPVNNGQRSIQLAPNQSVYLVRGTVRILLQNGPLELTIRENSFLSALERAQAQGWPPGVSASAGAYFRSEDTNSNTRWTASIFNANRVL